MKSFTQTPSGVCIFQDDLDGLNTLYPACENVVSVPQCFKSEQYLGFLRFSMSYPAAALCLRSLPHPPPPCRLFRYIAIPTVIILSITIGAHFFFTSRLKRHRDRLVARNYELASVTDKLRIEMEVRPPAHPPRSLPNRNPDPNPNLNL